MGRLPESTDHPVAVFLHIPKTAGTSIRRLLELNFSTNERLELYATRPGFTAGDLFRKQFALRAEPPKLVVGHISMPLIRSIPWRVKVATFLRDPLQLCLSRWRHWLRSKNPVHHQQLNSFHDINHYLETCQTNVMASRLGVATKLSSRRPFVALHRALRTIDQEIAFIGLAERFEQDSQHLAEVLGLTNYQYFQVNVAPASEQAEEPFHGASPAAVRIFQERNWVDYQLYDWVGSAEGIKKSVWHQYVRCRSMLGKAWPKTGRSSLTGHSYAA
ncbi:MAG: sulfotransferase family 2 domain-containing protein [Pirellulales bacterium]|nr:sulfotransferase family 2 domain-containing protein [Pirellulales bacterium]